MKIKRLLKDTAALTAASLFMRSVGLAFSSYLSRALGASGLGLLEMVLSVCSFAVSLAGSGIRLSSIRLTVSAQARGMCIRKTMGLCFAYSLAPGILAAAALFFGAPYAARVLGHTECAICMRMFAFSLPFISFSCALSGFFTAARRAGTYAAVQVSDQLFRIGITLALLRIFLPYGAVYACAAVIIGQCISEAVSTGVTFLLYLKCRGKKRTGRPALSELLRIALPDSVSSWLRSGLVTVRQMLIPRTMRQSGASAAQGLASYGVVQGMALPVIYFASCISGAFAGLLIPEIAECVAKSDKKRADALTVKALKITLIFSAAVAAAIYIAAPVISARLYPGTGAAFYIRLMAPIIPISYMDMTTDGILKGLGLQLDSMRYNIIEAAVCLAMVLVLVPVYGIWGYITMIFAGEILNFGMSINRLRKSMDELSAAPSVRRKQQNDGEKLKPAHKHIKR